MEANKYEKVQCEEPNCGEEAIYYCQDISEGKSELVCPLHRAQNHIQSSDSAPHALIDEYDEYTESY